MRPEFSSVMAVKSGKHPIKDKLSHSNGKTFVPNNIFCGYGSNVQIISGPNMSGKSTFLRMTVLITIMVL